MTKFINISPLFLLIGFLFSCNEEIQLPEEEEFDLTVYETLKQNKNYSILVEALEITELSKKLNQKKTNITLFAPDNDAFTEHFSVGIGGGVLKRIPKEELKQMLLGHIVEGTNHSSDLYSGYYPSQAKKGSNNKNLSIHISTLNNNVVLNGYSKVMQNDVQASNGTIHYVNKIIAPATLWTFLKADEKLSELFIAIDKNEMANQMYVTLDIKKPVTFFAPSNEAIKTKKVDKSTLLYHVAMKENLCSKKEDLKVESINGHKIRIKLKNNKIELIDEMNKSTELLLKSIQAVNGELHILNDVMTPKS